MTNQTLRDKNVKKLIPAKHVVVARTKRIDPISVKYFIF